MMLCARNSDEIKLFISRGHDINYQDKLGQTALHKAVEKNNIQLSIDLLKNGANPNIKNYLGATPVFFCKTKEMVNVLFKEAGSSILNSFDKDNKNAMSSNKLVSDYIKNVLEI